MILSLHPMVGGSRHLFRNKPSGPDAIKTGEAISSKGVLSAIVVHPELGEFFIANTHVAANYGPKLTFEHVRMRQLEEVAEIMARDGVLRGRPIPRILGGDLNVSPEGPSYTLLWDMLPMILPGYRRWVPPFPVSTRDDSNPYVDRDEGQLDHLFGFEGARPISGLLAFDSAGSFFSDHFGWETEFELPPWSR
jgi:endonuclease/exonuclease/phosphatase family metal-dependent hydrolase